MQGQVAERGESIIVDTKKVNLAKYCRTWKTDRYNKGVEL